MEPMKLSFGALMSYLSRAISRVSDPREESNATSYSVRDAILGAFSMFFMQNESFLEHQRQMKSRHGKSNAQTLFGVFEIPTTQQIKNIIDKIPAAMISGVFDSVYQGLRREGHLKPFQYLGGFLVALDGTQYFTSQKVHCDCCSSRTHKNKKVTYFHSAILPVIVAPRQSQVISLTPEFVTPQDGHEKQDCEVAAAKRWISANAAKLVGQPITLLGDDIYSRQPMCQDVLSSKMNFIFTCLPESHTHLYQHLEIIDALGEVKELKIKQSGKSSGEIYSYRYANQVPLNGSSPNFLVSWCELIVSRISDGEILFKNTFVTNHELTLESVVSVIAAGRCRWKTENENHNVLKTKGYNLEHNFGHGEEHLSSSLLTLNLLAFLFHTVLELVDKSYQQVRKQRVTRKGFFQDITSLTKYLLFEGWQALLDFMLYDPKPTSRANSP